MVEIEPIITQTRLHFETTLQQNGAKYPYSDTLLNHVEHVERWAQWMLERHPEADKSVVRLAVWLHDIGFLTEPEGIDHAVSSEIEARRVLPGFGVGNAVEDKVVHCVRAHRRKDSLPETLEAKILAFADSAGHLTDGVFRRLLAEGKIDEAREKLMRDINDLALFPEDMEELKLLFENWGTLIALKQREKICEKVPVD